MRIPVFEYVKNSGILGVPAPLGPFLPRLRGTLGITPSCWTTETLLEAAAMGLDGKAPTGGLLRALLPGLVRKRICRKGEILPESLESRPGWSESAEVSSTGGSTLLDRSTEVSMAGGLGLRRSLEIVSIPMPSSLAGLCGMWGSTTGLPPTGRGVRLKRPWFRVGCRWETLRNRRGGDSWFMSQTD